MSSAKKIEKTVDKALKNIVKLDNYSFKPKDKISWDAPEFYFYPKNKYWLLGIATMILGLMFVFVAAGQYLHYQFELTGYLVVVILALALVVFAQYGHVEPKVYRAELGTEGIFYRNHFYEYDKLKSFWIVEAPNPIVYFEILGTLLPVSILLQDQNIEEVRAFLIRYIPEHPTATEHITEKLNQFLRF